MHGSPVVDIQNNHGAAFIGLVVSTMLYGMTIAQTWFYFLQYRNRDPMVLRGFIASLFVLDTLQTILSIYSVYWYLVLNFGNVKNLGLNMWAMNFQVDVAGVVAFLVQLFYARRVYILSNNIVFPLSIAGLGSICLCLGFVIGAKIAALKQFSRVPSLTWITCVGMGSAASADILIVLSMCWCLYHKRSGLSKSDSVIMTLIAYSISTGMVTSLLSVGTLVAHDQFVASPDSLISMAFFWPLSKCYVNAFLAILNNRDNLRERPDSTFALSSVLQRNAPFGTNTGANAVAITVHQSTTADSNDNKLKEEGLSESIAV